jgi:hypothetical protein
MLWVLAAIFMVLWLFGVITAHMFGGYLHILLVIAVILIVIKLITG